MSNIVLFRSSLYNNRLILSTEQLANAYGVASRRISENFNRNADHFTEGNDFLCLEGDTLQTFKSEQDEQAAQSLKGVNKLYLWTESGAFIHAKFLRTDDALEGYRKLSQLYYAQQTKFIQEQQERIKKLASLIGKNMTIPSLPPNVLGNVHADQIENAVSRLRGLIKPFKEYVEKAQKKRQIYLSTEEGQQLVSALQAMHENLNTIYVQSEHMQEVMDMGDMQFIKQESIIRQITQALELPMPPELQALPEPE